MWTFISVVSNNTTHYLFTFPHLTFSALSLSHFQGIYEENTIQQYVQCTYFTYTWTVRIFIYDTWSLSIKEIERGSQI